MASFSRRWAPECFLSRCLCIAVSLEGHFSLTKRAEHQVIGSWFPGFNLFRVSPPTQHARPHYSALIKSPSSTGKHLISF